jgi:phosphonate degradation associated HDIG domain protein
VRLPVDPDALLDSIAEIFVRHGAEAYLGEPVTMAEHMLQAAALAEAEGASDALVAATLLHDIGHFTGESGPYSPDDILDRAHETAGARTLAAGFPAVVTESVRLHVAAKRFLCATDMTYAARLSAASRHSLALQGGAMNAEEIDAFRRLSFHRDAVRLRLWDDAAKVPGRATPTFDHFGPLLRRVACAGGALA